MDTAAAAVRDSKGTHSVTLRHVLRAIGDRCGAK
jgi:hypothetical protein